MIKIESFMNPEAKKAYAFFVSKGFLFWGIGQRPVPQTSESQAPQMRLGMTRLSAAVGSRGTILSSTRRHHPVRKF